MEKLLRDFQVKNADRGEVQAVFSTFNVVDSDGDVTLAGAFTDGAEVPISAYGHQSWQGALPAGRGVIRTSSSEAILDGRFFLDTQAGRETFITVKELGPLQQWSYGYDAIDAEPGTFQGKRVRFLKRLDVSEVSPVLAGSGVDTRTLALKGAGGALSPAQLEEIALWLEVRAIRDEWQAREDAAREYLRFIHNGLAVA